MAGSVEDLGSPLRTVLVHEGGFGPGPDGRLLAYAVLQGDNAGLNVLDAATGERLAVHPLPGATGGWGITVTDAGTVYLGSYYNGHLYRYRPERDDLTDLGQPVEGDGYLWGLSHGPDGAVYGGTYPTASVFAFDPATETFRTLGRFAAENTQYARSTAFDPATGTLFVGTGMGAARLHAIDVATGRHREVMLPEDLADRPFVDLRCVDGKVFAALDYAALVVLDAVTGERLALQDAGTGEQVATAGLSSHSVSEALDGRVYFSAPEGDRQRLMWLDLATLTYGPVPVQPEAPELPGAAIGLGLLPDGSGVVAWAGQHTGQAIRYDLAGERLSMIDYDVRAVPAHMLHLVAAPDRELIFLSAGQQGDFGSYDPATRVAVKGPRYEQVEGWLWLDGLLYSGTYPYGIVQVWDPAKPEQPPRVLARLKEDHHQNRPMTLTSDGNCLFVGTTPGYAEFGGAITVIDLRTEEFRVHRNVIMDQTISALLAEPGRPVLGGSSVDGGTGTDPRDGEAHLFRFDPATATVITDVVPVPGARSVNALIKLASGDHWGLADGTAFRFDPDTLAITRTVELYDPALKSGALDGELIEHPDGLLYASSRHQVFAFDPAAGSAAELIADGVHRLTCTASGALYGLGQAPDSSGAYTRLLALHRGGREPGPD
ncbi:hypothetical protein [Microlunatus sp. GCM10028923]|uniref:hypothetical protein n=1 Tax=Microlunatus sp. GCM10028923 TaxID=3273400 RepID=UPI00361BBD70